ncbi:MAG: class I SAM-dependent methyltransferase [Akkermansiaceae bacterium]|nr:class I SAM-dependent methyltransferase [Akkermansiaceae bacterium]
MRKRVVLPELLDHLPADDPEARRSRCDLQRINQLLGNGHWACRTARSFPAAAQHGIHEIGAGDGKLCSQLARLFPQSPVSAYDLAPRPMDLEARVVWQSGNLFSLPAPATGGMLVANLFIHHFEGDSLKKLGRWLENFEILILSEPDRSLLPHLLGGLMHPWINRVTRHDMHVSIRAGFAAGEIASLLGLGADHWRICETSTWLGARRVVALRH